MKRVGSSSRSSVAAPFVIHLKPFRRTITQLRINDGEVTIRKHIPIDLDEKTANLNGVTQKLAEQGYENFHVLDSNFDQVEDNKFTRNELYWSIRNKFYFVSKAEWKKFIEMNNENEDQTAAASTPRRFKKFNYPVESTEDLMSSIRPIRSAYFPVTGPATFRRNFIEIRIVNNQICKLRNTPFELTDPMANIPTLKCIIERETGIKDVIILDSQYREVRDSPTTRGFDFFSFKKNFYFINRDDWYQFDNESRDDCKFHLIKNKMINYSSCYYGWNDSKAHHQQHRHRKIKKFQISN